MYRIKNYFCFFRSGNIALLHLVDGLGDFGSFPASHPSTQPHQSARLLIHTYFIQAHSNNQMLALRQMSSGTILNGIRATAIRLGAAFIPLAVIVGCASPAPPRPPSLNLPEPIRDLSAQRIGDRVLLTWTTPEKTTDRLPVKGAMTADICRTPNSLAGPPPPGTPCTPLPVSPGPSSYWQSLPADLTADPVRLIAFRVSIRNSSGRAAPTTPQVLVPAGAAPPPVEPLRIASSRDGVELTWTRSSTPATVQLDRLALNPDGTPVITTPKPAVTSPATSTNTTHHPSAQTQKKGRKTQPPAAPAPSEPTRLRSPQPDDPGGLLDQTAVRGQSYRYIARRIRTVTLDGQTYQLESPASAPVTVTFRDTFPPHTPSGLIAVANPGPQAPSIDLSWTPVPDLDLTGYLVFRRQLEPTPETSWTLLTPTPIPAPGYSDITAVTGQRYAYHVTAVDASGNQSPPSQDAQETLTKP